MSRINLEKLIKDKLIKTRACAFKETILNNLLGKGWTCVNISKFAKELTKLIKSQ